MNKLLIILPFLLVSCRTDKDAEISASTYNNLEIYLELKSADDPRRVYIRKALSDNKITHRELDEFWDVEKALEKAQAKASLRSTKRWLASEEEYPTVSIQDL